LPRLDTDAAWRSLETAPPGDRFSDGMVEELPAIGRRYLAHAIAPDTPLASSVTLTMSGAIKPGGPWMRFKARQVLTPGLGFIWSVSARWGPLMISGEDYLVQGGGGTYMRLFGVAPFLSAGGPDVTRSALGRLAAESVLLPSSLLPLNGATWHEDSGGRARVDVPAGDGAETLSLSIGEEGQLREVVIDRWGNQTESGDFALIPFGVKVHDESTFGGYTIPTRLEAGWWFGSERYAPFFRAEIEEAAFR